LIPVVSFGSPPDDEAESAVLVLVAHPPHVRNQRHAPRADRGLEVQELLQRQLVELGWFVRYEPDLVDVQELDPVVLPVVGVPAERRLGQERRGEGARGCGLAEAGLADEEIRVGEPAGIQLRAQLPQCLKVSYDSSERIAHRVCGFGAGLGAAAAFASRSR